MKRIASCIVLVMLVASVGTGCMRPVMKPVLETIKPNETAFLINVDEGAQGQAKFQSVDFLEKAKVAAKRIEIKQRFLKTGRFDHVGKWIPTQLLIKVDRTPVARRWTAEENTGTSKDTQVLMAESKDSIGVMSGMAITAYVKEEDTARFLYRYPNGNLASIIDNQIFNDCQAVYSEVAAKYEVKDLRLHKDEINSRMVETVIPMYAEDGITIKPSMGLIGGLVYDNVKIQEAIDSVFIQQTLEAKRIAEAKAQEIENTRLLSVEKNEAEKRKVKADAEAYEIASKAKAISDGGNAYLELLRLEVEKARIDKWKGEVSMVQGGGGMSPVVPVVLPASETK